MRTVLSGYSNYGVTVENVIYRWRNNDSMVDRDDSLTLKFLRERRVVRAQALDIRNNPVPIGRLILAPPDIALTARATQDEPRQRSTIFHFDEHLVAQLLRQYGDGLKVEDFEPDLDLRIQGVDWLLLRLASEIARPHLGGYGAVQGLLQLLTIDIARHHREVRDVLCTTGGLSQSRLDHIMNFVDQTQVGFPSPADVADECGLSPSHLRRLFKRETGQTLQEFLAVRRIERACALLLQTDLPLKAISYRLGFKHCSAFAATFRAAIGETPGKYREQALTGQMSTAA